MYDVHSESLRSGGMAGSSSCKVRMAESCQLKLTSRSGFKWNSHRWKNGTFAYLLREVLVMSF